MTNTTLANALFDIGAIKIDFKKGWTTKSGMWTPIYVDLRLLQSHPVLLKDIAKMMHRRAVKDGVRAAVVASIPFGGLPIGIAYSLVSETPHILPRMATKDHGVVRRIDGVFKPKQRVLLVDDLITSATSKFEAVKELEMADLIIKDVLVVLDREQGGTQQLKKEGITLHKVITMNEVLAALQGSKRMTAVTAKKLQEYFEKNSVRH